MLIYSTEGDTDSTDRVEMDRMDELIQGTRHESAFGPTRPKQQRKEKRLDRDDLLLNTQKVKPQVPTDYAKAKKLKMLNKRYTKLFVEKKKYENDPNRLELLERELKELNKTYELVKNAPTMNNRSK